MRREFLSFSPPLIGQEEIDEVVASLRSGWITTGPRVERFQEDFKTFIGAPASLALNSCTSALHIALAALGIGRGDKVVSTPMTFCSSIHVIEHVGATPILVDVERDTLNIDPDKVEAAVRANPEVKAILPVHLYGHPCEMDPILDIAKRYGLAVIEDAAHSLPARYRGRLIGTPASQDEVTNLVAFSFYATKNLTTGEGGMLTGPADVIDTARIWSLHGMSRDAYKRYTAEGSWSYEVVLPGFKYNMPDLQAAIGIQQLRKLPELQRIRKSHVERYNRAFRTVEEVQTPVEREHVESAWHIYLLRLNLDLLKIDRAQFIEELRVMNIGSSVHFIPVHLHPYYRDKYGYQPEDYPIAYHEYLRCISLPLSPSLSDADIDDVIDAVTAIVERHRR
jgi:dTDP-4-amino-4,6-dideoxygalactose transaminase